MTPFLLVPGLNCTAEVFAGLMPVLWPHGPVTIANHTVGDGVAEIAANILKDAPPRFALLGYSLGGYLAFEIFRQAPERVERLCLIGTSARPDTPEVSAKRRGGIELARQGMLSDLIRAGFPFAVHPDQLRRDDLADLLVRMGTANGVDTYVRHQEAIIARPDSQPELARIRVKTLVVVGDSDQTAVPAAAREMAEGIAGARLVVVPRAGHLVLLEKPEPVLAAVEVWARD